MQIISVTTDSASNNLTFMRALTSYCDTNKISMGSSIESHLRCFLHVLNLAAQEFLSKIKCGAPSEDDPLNEEDEDEALLNRPPMNQEATIQKVL